jgi:hypothetical protein
MQLELIAMVLNHESTAEKHRVRGGDNLGASVNIYRFVLLSMEFQRGSYIVLSAHQDNKLPSAPGLFGSCSRFKTFHTQVETSTG